jgi:hypothetical protein
MDEREVKRRIIVMAVVVVAEVRKDVDAGFEVSMFDGSAKQR